MSRRTPRPLVALFTAGYLAPYLLPTVVGRLGDSLRLPPAQAGLIGSALLMSSAAAGFTFAGRVDRLGPRTLARFGLLLAAFGYGAAAATSWMPLVVVGAMAGGFGSGTATTVAATGIAAQRDPHRASTLGLLSVSALAGALYLTLPQLGPDHALPFAAIALTALATWPATAGLGKGAEPDAAALSGKSAPATPLPYRRSGLVLAGAMLCWSMAQNSLWGVSSRIGTDQAGLTEITVGAVFAVALGTALVGVLGAGALGSRLGRAVPIGAGTALIACCIVLSARADDLTSFATGEIAWNTVYPVVLSYLIGLAASLDPRGRWAVFVGSASSLGTACGPLTGSLLSQAAGYPAMGATLAALLLVLALPLTAVALHTGGRPLLPGTVRRRGGAPAALVAGVTGAPAGAVPQLGAAEQPVVEITVSTPQPVPTQEEFSTAGPRGGPAAGQSSNANASTSAR
ncbi:MFS transporter [Streptomyces sp. NPDC058067]|uniref:MFS transporter n=1 Tax=Streptomyces sp. NPDC058067 TaxID=3346324 RepID=UPI0036E4E24D